jgi:uncharacterized NAD(P)/FAD-binding protein YdhS
MHVSINGKGESEQTIANAAWEKSVNTSMQDILEILEDNVKWWEQAAVTCEQTAARLSTGEKEGWQLMGAVYQERAVKHTRLIEQLRREKTAARG